MFPIERQRKLDRVLPLLRQIEGVTQVWTDDWDSTAINVFLDLDTMDSERGSVSGKNPMRFKSPLRKVKAAIRKACKDAGLDFNFLDWPAPQYSSTTILGRRETFKEGYDGSDIKIEVFA